MKVLIIGGYMCGKNAMLASMYNQLVTSESRRLLTVADKTSLNSPNVDLNLKRLEMIDCLCKKPNGLFVLNSHPSRVVEDYTFEFRETGTIKGFEILFRIVPPHGVNQQFLSNYELINDFDTYIVAIDTPYLMDDSEAVCEYANITHSVERLLFSISSDVNNKQVLFVPLKCERWVKDGTINQVVDKVKNVYGHIIAQLKIMPNLEVSIIPAETTGDIVFDSMGSACLLYNKITNTSVKCTKLTDKLVRLRNGKIKRVDDTNIITPDFSSFFLNTDIERPLEWFKLRSDVEPKYRPHNCDQLAFHVIRFMIKSFYKKLTEVRGKFNIINHFIDPTDKILYQYGFRNMKEADPGSILERLESNKIIKDNCDGITALKSL